MSEWISVNECLPEMHETYAGSPLTSGSVLIFNGHYVTVGKYAETYKKRARRWIESTLGLGANVTHWMPLPPPPGVALEACGKDTARLDALQAMTTGYGIGWVLRNSSTGRGMRLHETSAGTAFATVRAAIDAALPPAPVSVGAQDNETLK